MRPMLCKVSKTPIVSDEYIVEHKYDGVRALLTVKDGTHYLETRTGQDISYRFPEIVPIQAYTDYILDGELCCFTNGVSDFQKMQARVQRDNLVNDYAYKYPAKFMVFDCLCINSLYQLDLPLMYRKRNINTFVTNTIEAVPYSLSTDPNWTEAMFADTEGFVYKQRNSTYQEGKRTNSWIKHKFLRREKVYVVGFTHGAGKRAEYFGALVVARYDPNTGTYLYAGTVGTGFTDIDLFLLTNRFVICNDTDRDLLTRTMYHVAVEPFEVMVEYMELTNSGVMRQPSFKYAT